MYHKKAIHFIPHAIERFVKWNIPKDEIRKLLKMGVIIDDLSNTGVERKICICKYNSKFHTIVFQPFKDFVFIITGYPSKPWEINQFKRIKRMRK